jgi:hypothetical protein
VFIAKDVTLVLLMQCVVTVFVTVSGVKVCCCNYDFYDAV